MSESSITYTFSPIFITLTIVTFVSNVLLCGLIFLSRTLRQHLRYWFIVGVSACDIFTGICSSLWIAAIYGRVDHTCGSLMLLTAFGSYAMEFINFWYMVMLNLDYCSRLFQRRPKELSPCGRIIMNLTLTLLPWTGSCILVIFGVVFGLHHYARRYWEIGHCPVVLTFDASVVLKVLSCAVPGILIMITLGVMIFKHWRRNRVGSYAHMTSRLINDEGPPIESPLCYVVASMVTIFCSLPREIFGLVMHQIKDFEPIILTSFITVTLLIAKAAILPYVWLLLAEFRLEIKKKANMTHETGHATFRRFPEQHDSGEVTISHSEED